MAHAGGPRLCVVVPTLDEEACLGALLERLLGAREASDRADHVVVSDGGSRDRTLAIARAHGAATLGGAPGRGAQLRRGAQAAGARDEDALLFLHADCVPHAGALRELRRALADPALRWGALHQRLAARGLFFRLAERAASARVRALGLVYGDCGLFVRAADYRAAGGFAELPLFEDLELSRRLRARGRPRVLRAAGLSVSARRWRAEGVLRVTLRNWIIQAAFLLGVDPRRLARHYPRAPRGRGPGGVAVP
jgi:rSAM/selenodomain-associated transferase 2